MPETAVIPTPVRFDSCPPRVDPDAGSQLGAWRREAGLSEADEVFGFQHQQKRPHHIGVWPPGVDWSPSEHYKGPVPFNAAADNEL